MMESPIDVVITWVNGSDPAHSEKRNRYLSEDLRSHHDAIDPTRFAHLGEIYYSIASILKYAGFVNKIWIVTDDQRPQFIDAFYQSGLCAPDFIQIVDHRDIFFGYEDVLPTFNSRTIETMLWRIPNLAEHFVYLNDDFFINRPLNPNEWFVDGKPILRGKIKPSTRWKVSTIFRKLTFRWPRKRPTFHYSQELASNVAGVYGDYLHTDHYPHPLRRSIQEDFYLKNPKILREQIRYRFRNSRQFNPVSLANHLEITRTGLKFFDILDDLVYIENNESLMHEAEILKKLLLEDGCYGCIQSLDKFPHESAELINDTMKKKFDVFLPF